MQSMILWMYPHGMALKFMCPEMADLAIILPIKKQVTKLKTMVSQDQDPFTATPDHPEVWRTENVNLTPYHYSRQKNADQVPQH